MMSRRRIGSGTGVRAALTAALLTGAVWTAPVVPTASAAQNRPPIISSIADQWTAEDETLGPIPFTIDDPDSPLATLVVTVSSSDPMLVPEPFIALHGVGAERAVTLTPAANQAGVATITLIVNDGLARAATTFMLTVREAGDAPVPTTDRFAVQGGAVLTVHAPGVLTNDTDDAGLPLSARLVAGPSRGTLLLDPNGGLLYTPTPGFSGVDYFLYEATNGRLSSPATMVTIFVDPAPGADLIVTQAVGRAATRVGAILPYTFTVRNDGPNVATDTVLTVAPPSHAHHGAAVSSHGRCSPLGGGLACRLGRLEPGQVAMVRVPITPTRAGSLMNVARVRSDQPDPNPQDNTSTAHWVAAP